MRQQWGKEKCAAQLLPTSSPPQKKKKKNTEGHINMQQWHIHKKTPEKAVFGHWLTLGTVPAETASKGRVD